MKKQPTTVSNPVIQILAYLQDKIDATCTTRAHIYFCKAKHALQDLNTIDAMLLVLHQLEQNIDLYFLLGNLTKQEADTAYAVYEDIYKFLDGVKTIQKKVENA